MCLSFDFSCNCWWNAMLSIGDFILIGQMRERSEIITSRHVVLQLISQACPTILLLLPWFKDFFSSSSFTLNCTNKARDSSLISFFSSALFLCFSLALFWDKKTDTHSIVNWSRAIHFYFLFIVFYISINLCYWCYPIVQRDLSIIIKR